MEFLQIGEAKLKIVMAEAELKENGLTGLPESGPECRRAIWRILDKAKSEVGFDPAGDKILVQFYPTKGSGCELFVTKLGILAPTSAKLVSKSDRITMLSRRRSLYGFATASHLVSYARELCQLAQKPACDLYEASDGSYILVVVEYGHGADPVEYAAISEFAVPLSEELFPYVTEHLTRVAQGDGLSYAISNLK